MPELPDLQVFSRNLQHLLGNKRLKTVKLFKKKNSNQAELKIKKALEGQKLKKVSRSGKEIHFLFENDQILALHLMLKGKLNLEPAGSLPRSGIVQLKFEEEITLTLSDQMGKASLRLNPEASVAPDVLSPEVNAGFLGKLFKKSKGTIKKLLTDQKKLRGIGNAYADEILWHARISPLSKASSIPNEKIKLLLKSIRSVLKNAEKQIVKNDPGRISGEYRDFLKVHNAARTHSPEGAEIIVTELDGRKTYYTSEQELFT